MSSFIIKIIAISTMLIDHIGYYVYSDISWMHYIGRIAFPLFAFQLAIGYKNTKSLWKYATRLFILAFISQVPYALFQISLVRSVNGLNVLFTLLLGLAAMYIYDYKVNSKDKLMPIFMWVTKIILISSLCLIAKMLKFDYDIFGILLILSIHVLYENKKTIPFILSYLILVFGLYYERLNNLPVNTVLLLCLFTFLPIIFMYLYNGKKGANTRHWFYIIYPAHLLIFAFIKFYIVLFT